MALKEILIDNNNVQVLPCKRYSVGEGENVDYYPFGMPMPGRSFNSSEYRYGFNGFETDFYPTI